MQFFTPLIPSKDDSGFAGSFFMRLLLRRKVGDIERDKLEPVTDLFIFL